MDNAELERFRKLWISEMNQRANSGSRIEENVAESQDKAQIAMNHFILASDFERVGNMADAMKHYRIATRLDPDVEMNHWKFISNHPITQENYITVVQVPVEAEILDSDDEQDIKPSKSSEILNESNEPGKECLLLALPTEIIHLILKWALKMDISSFMIISLCCKKLKGMVRDQEIWKDLCCAAHVDSSISSLSNQLNLYQNDWFMMWKRKPRIRLEGVYISKVTYKREGLADTLSMTPVIDYITYYRYLRFYSNHKVVAMTTPIEPANIVYKLRQDAKLKDMSVGSWVWQENAVIKVEYSHLSKPELVLRARVKLISTMEGTDWYVLL